MEWNHIPVSYTHLDVYKRQVPPNYNFCISLETKKSHIFVNHQLHNDLQKYVNQKLISKYIYNIASEPGNVKQFYEKNQERITLAGFSACGGSLQRHYTSPPQCDPAPVSYTHLDVYKRQPSGLRTAVA